MALLSFLNYNSVQLACQLPQNPFPIYTVFPAISRLQNTSSEYPSAYDYFEIF